MIEELVDGEWIEISAREAFETSGPRPYQKLPRRVVTASRRRLSEETAEGTEITLDTYPPDSNTTSDVGSDSDSDEVDDESFENTNSAYEAQSNDAELLNGGADSVLKSIYSGDMESTLGIPVEPVTVYQTPRRMELVDTSSTLQSGIFAAPFQVRILDGLATECLNLLVSEPVQVNITVSSPAGVSVTGGSALVVEGRASFSGFSLSVPTNYWSTKNLRSGMTVHLRYSTNVADIPQNATLILSAAPPSQPEGFVCDFACDSETQSSATPCPCSTVECSTGALRLIRAEVPPLCLYTIHAYCSGSAGEGEAACNEYNQAASEVADATLAEGGLIERNTPEMGGHPTSLQIPAAALNEDITLALAEFSETDIAAKLNPTFEV
eukprot:gene6663-7976_t